MLETYPINIWINEERFEKLKAANLADMAVDRLGGMKVIQVQCTEEQKDKILKHFPMAKFDTATTKSIELLPREVKDKIFDIAIKLKSIGPDVIDEFFKSLD
ncbi:MAG: hypothetical protein LWW94_06770 [Candidatus Desulfofervidaceae bacterium]|nr:hypothetical protein [Candidatus Desulfofervidaceae bacterium]